MASMNTRLNIEKLDGKIFGAQGDRKAEVFQVSNDDTAVAQRRLEDKESMEYMMKSVFGLRWNRTRDKEQHSAHELLKYREDSNEAAFAVAEAEKIYAHESLTFNNTVACEVISKWKAGLKDDMDARSDVYVLSNGCKKCSDDIDVYYWEYTPAKAKLVYFGMEIVRDQSGNTLRVSQSRFYNEKLVQTLLEGHSILSLEGSLSGDCDVEKNAAYMTLTEAAKEAIWLKGLAIESGFMLKIVVCIATGALSKAIPGPRFQHRSKLLRIGID
ncbi:hypothetical protein Tco_1089242 [Tanacetum coccineum]